MKPRLTRRLLLLGAGFSPLLARPAAADADGPRPPCNAPPDPPYPADTAAAPTIRTWHVANWPAPACLGWSASRATLLVALAGRFRHAGTAADLLARFGAVSSLRGTKYWSVTDRAWRVLITDATALTAPDARRRRPDFTAADLAAGGELYTAEQDTRSSSPVVFRLRVPHTDPDRLVITLANVSPVRLSLVTLFDPGDLQTTYVLERLAPAEWGFYGLWGITTGLFTSGHEASSINRAVALYRHVRGIPTDDEPPVAR